MGQATPAKSLRSLSPKGMRVSPKHIGCRVAQQRFPTALAGKIAIAANKRSWNAVNLAHDQFRRRREFVCDSNHTGMHFVAVGVGLPAIIDDRLHTCYANRHVDLTFAPGSSPGIR